MAKFLSLSLRFESEIRHSVFAEILFRQVACEQKVCEMKFKEEFLILIVFVAFTAHANPTQRAVENCGKKPVSVGLVFGGVYSRRHSWPWIVNFQRVIDNQVFCGGSLVSVKHVVSGEKIEQIVKMRGGYLGIFPDFLQNHFHRDPHATYSPYQF